MALLNKLKKRAKALKSEAKVLIIAYQDKRTPAFARILIWITVAYLLSPVDLIPDFIPILGILDDLIIVPGLIALSFRLIPKEVIVESREKLLKDTEQLKKNKWIFAILIVLLWITIGVFAIRFLHTHARIFSYLID